MVKPAAVDTQDKYLVPGLARGLRVLCEVGRTGNWTDAPELARKLQVPRTTVFRLLSTLEQLGFVSRNEEAGHKFGLGMSGLRLGFQYLASLSVTEHGDPVLQALRDEWGYACHLVVRDQTDVVYVAKAASLRPLTSSVKVGTRLPAHATVFGRVLLQDLSLQDLHDLYPAATLAAHSASTPTSVDQLYALLRQDRRQVHVCQQGFFEPSIATVAAPVRDATGQIVAALGMTVPDTQAHLLASAPLAAAVCEAAARLSSLLDGGMGSPNFIHSTKETPAP